MSPESTENSTSLDGPETPVEASARARVLEHFRWINGHADVWAIFRNAEALAAVVPALVEPFIAGEGGGKVTAVCFMHQRQNRRPPVVLVKTSTLR